MAELADQAANPAADGTERTLRAIRLIAAEMLHETPKPLRGLRLRAGDVSLELEWPETAQATMIVPHASAVSANGHKADIAIHDLVAPEAKAEPERSGAMVRAPMVGVFYRSPQPGMAPFVSEGDLVTPGQQVAIIEAMKLMIPVEADDAGRITSVLVSDGHPVEYGQPLFAVDTDI